MAFTLAVQASDGFAHRSLTLSNSHRVGLTTTLVPNVAPDARVPAADSRAQRIPSMKPTLLGCYPHGVRVRAATARILTPFDIMVA
jgi:hypothetical protein